MTVEETNPRKPPDPRDPKPSRDEEPKPNPKAHR